MWMRRAPLSRALRSLGRAVGAGVALSLAAAPSSAAVMRYSFGGSITAADPSTGVAVGTPFSGTFTYDPTGPQDYSEPRAYIPEAPIYQFARSTSGADLAASVGGNPVFGQAAKLDITVQGPYSFMGPGDPQGLVIESGLDPSHVGSSVKLSFLNANHPLPFRYSLPQSFGLDDFTSATFSISGPDGKALYEGAITSLTPEPTPEPSTLAILATAGGFALARSRPRRRKLVAR